MNKCETFKMSISLTVFTYLLKIYILEHNILRHIPLDI